MIYVFFLQRVRSFLPFESVNDDLGIFHSNRKIQIILIEREIIVVVSILQEWYKNLPSEEED